MNFAPSDVSAVICTMNSAKSIEACLTSLRECQVGEIIVVDAHSSDGTREIAGRLADLIVSDPGLGLGQARNIGIGHTKMPLILNMGSDNVVDPLELGKMIDFLHNGHYEGVSAQTRVEGKDFVSLGLNFWRRARFPVGERTVIGTPTLFVGDLLRSHPFDGNRKYSDDSELCERWANDLNARFAISDAIFKEVGKETWDEVVVRARMYGESDFEVFQNGSRSGWGLQRKSVSVLHPLKVDFLMPLASVRALSDLRQVPFLSAFTAMRYFYWLKKSVR